MRVILIVVMAWLLILSFVFHNETVDFQLYNTYYIIGVSYIMLTLAGLVLFGGLVLWLFLRKEKKIDTNMN
jgi:LPXTG-motif cell wall-anchored protein